MGVTILMAIILAAVVALGCGAWLGKRSVHADIEHGAKYGTRILIGRSLYRVEFDRDVEAPDGE